MNSFVKIPKVYRKLKQAEEEFRPIYVSGATGYGKTVNVEHYFRYKSTFMLSGKKGSLETRPPVETIRQGIVIIDDLSRLSDEESKQYILELLYHSGKLVVLIGRGVLPGWLEGAAVELSMIMAGEIDLEFDEEAIGSYFEQNKVNLDERDISRVVKSASGYPLFVVLLSQRISEGLSPNEAVFQEVKLEIFRYFDNAVFLSWDERIRKMMLMLCPYEEFSAELAAWVSGEDDAAELLEYCRSLSAFLNIRDEQNYYLTGYARKFLNWKRKLLYTEKEEKENYSRVARFYELHGDIEKTMECYLRAGDNEKIRDLLIRNSKLNPGVGDYFSMRKYYQLLPEELILDNPILISGISMMYSVLLMPEESERWYEELKKAGAREKDLARKKEIKIRLAYLDIALPHRGIRNMVDIIKNTAIYCMNISVDMPEFSVTSNLPSVMNGGLDFCEWSKRDRELSLLLYGSIDVVLGRFAKGLVDIALSESRFEKGDEKASEVLSGLNRGYMQADIGGKIEMCFVSTAIQVKQHLIRGQMDIGRELIEKFKRKVVKEEAKQLQSNLNAFEVWFSLYSGKSEKAEQYLKEAPQEQVEFCSLDRYLYLVKIRCLIALDKKEMALSLIERLNIYFEKYERIYMWMENQFLKAILLYRMGDPDWERVFEKAYTKAEEYHFVRIISLEGGAMLPLLEHAGVYKETAFFEQVLKETKRLSRTYPGYLKKQRSDKVKLTEKEFMILQAMCQGETTEEICSEHGFTYSGLKYHNRNIYRKLNVSTRSEAEREALRRGYVHVS
jgi:LuxR family maltose regulon positive regulatory protein